nr:SPOR domain-containing protein [Vibrio fluminensis]
MSSFLLPKNPRQLNNNKGRITNMDINLLPKSAVRANLLTMLVLGSAYFALPVNAQEVLCDATQASTHELPLLTSSCPIGKGLWGKQQPRGSESTFWIQCGVLSKPLSLDEAKVIYQHISTDVWGKIEGKNARCLIGPYQDFATASKELQAVKKLKSYEQAFIREVVKGAPAVKKTNKTQAVEHTPVEKTAPARQTTTLIPPVKPQKVTAVKATPVLTPTTENKLEISIRREIKIGDLSFKVPYLPFGDDQFYMEYDKPWTRLNFAKASQVCHALNMEVPSREQWQTLLDADVMQSNQWPMYLPYWGAENSALFTSGKMTTTSGKSLLNVMCVG